MSDFRRKFLITDAVNHTSRCRLVGRRTIYRKDIDHVLTNFPFLTSSLSKLYAYSTTDSKQTLLLLIVLVCLGCFNKTPIKRVVCKQHK